MNLYAVIAIIIAVRLLSVFLVQTYYVPDEYWQSLEVAHRLVFGYGHLTWEWVAGIRSYVYPLFFAGIYKILAIFNLDRPELLVYLPRVAQALLTSYADYRFFVWSGRKKWALYLTLIPWFMFYIGSRTLANTLEASLTTIALSYFPWYTRGSGYLWLVALLCYLRPTAVIIWLPICYHHLIRARAGALQLILERFVPIGIIVAGICITIDSHFYGRWIVTPLEFLKYNVFHNIGSFYGSHSWYWYFVVGLPTVLGITTIPFLYGAVETIRHRRVFPIRRQLLISILFSLITLSLLEHKEFRFVAALLPLCLYICADTLTRYSYKASHLSLWIIAIGLFVGNVLPAWYLGTVHQQGSIELMPKIREIARDYRDDTRRASILFLMPCHSTPYYSHVHENVTMRFLTCEPNFNNQPNYVDEADEFYNAPRHWLLSRLPIHPPHAKPSHIILFDTLERNISDYLMGYKVLHRLEHAEYASARTGKEIVVYQRLGSGEAINVFNRDDIERKKNPKKQGLYPDPNVEETDHDLYDGGEINFYN